MPPPNIAMESGDDGLFFDDDASDDDIDSTTLLLPIVLRLLLSSTTEEERKIVVNGVTGASRSDDRIISKSLIALSLSLARGRVYSVAAAQLPWTWLDSPLEVRRAPKKKGRERSERKQQGVAFLDRNR